MLMCDISGKMFKSADLPFVVEFFLMFHADKPIDWLLDHLLMVKVCNPEKDQVIFTLFTCCLVCLVIVKMCNAEKNKVGWQQKLLHSVLDTV